MTAKPRMTARLSNDPTPDGSAHEPRELEEMLAFRISILSKLLDRRLARLIGDEFGLAIAEYRVLGQIVIRPQSTVRAIAARTYVDKAQVSRAVAVLEGQGLLKRSTGLLDKRSPVFEATAEGRALLDRIVPLRRAQEDELVAQVDPDQLKLVTSALDALIERVAPPSPAQRAEPTVADRRRAIREARVAAGRS